MNVLDVVDAASLRKDIPSFRSGDELKVHVRVIEGNKSRIQVFQGVVIARSGSGIRESFTIRKISYGVGVERTFPVHTPVIERIEITRHGSARRAKLYYLRKLTGKATKIKERRGADGEIIVEPEYVPPVVSKKVEVPVVGEAAEPVAPVAEAVAEEVVVVPAVAVEETATDADKRVVMIDEALEHLVKGIVDNPEEVVITEKSSRGGTTLEVRVHPEDIGKVIGRNGRTAKALRTVVSALAGRSVRVDLIEADEVR